MRVLSLVILLVGFGFFAKAVDITCLTVESENVSVSWEVYDNLSNDFGRYELYFSTDGGNNFTVFNITDVNTTNYYHISVLSGVNREVRYYVRVVDDSDDPIPGERSDIVSSSHLQISMIGLSVASISWNAPVQGSANFTGSYQVQRNIDGLGWQTIGTTNTTGYIDTVSVCGLQVDYRLSYNQLGCTQISNVVGEEFDDNIVPITPVMDSISIEQPDGLVRLGWQLSPSEDVIGYVIYKFDGSVSVAIDTVFGASNSTYLTSESDASIVSESYRIASIDSCENTSAMGLFHGTIHLTRSVDICNRLITLNFTSYSGWAVDRYLVLSSLDAGPFEILDTLTAIEDSIVLEGLQDSSEYCFAIRALGGASRSSTSNQLCMHVDWLNQPDIHYISNVIPDTSSLNLVLRSDSLASISQYFVYRNSSQDGEWELYDSIVNTYTSTILYRDSDVSIDRYYYQYFTVAEDDCGAIIDSSNVINSVLIEAVPYRSYENEILFNPLNGWLSDAEIYDLNRVNVSEQDTQVVFSANAINDSIRFIDDVGSEINGDAQFCYYVSVSEGGGNPHGFREVSQSNTVCVFQYGKLYIPNAFTPNNDGVNDLFCIDGIGVSSLNYQMQIFNRRGTMVRKITDKQMCWDGLNENGNPVPTGVYVYITDFFLDSGFKSQVTGNVSLIR